MVARKGESHEEYLARLREEYPYKRHGYHKVRYIENRTAILKHHKEYRNKNPDMGRKHLRKRYKRVRTQALDILGNKCIVCNATEDLEIFVKAASPLKSCTHPRKLYYEITLNPSTAIRDCELLCKYHRHTRVEFATGKRHTPESLEKIRYRRSIQLVPSKDTVIERMIHDRLTALGIQFIKHKSFKLGNSYHQADIFIEPNIVIEADGDYWHSLPHAIKRDARINKALEEQGYKVLRFWEKDIKNNLDKVIAEIMIHIQTI